MEKSREGSLEARVAAVWIPPPPRYDAGSLVPLRIEGYEMAKAKKMDATLVRRVWQNCRYAAGKAYTYRYNE